MPRLSHMPILFLAFIALAAITVPEQTSAALGDHKWSRGFDTEVRADVDPAGAVVMSGIFFGTVDFGGGPLNSTNFIFGDMFVAQLDAAGNHLYSYAIVPTQGLIVKLVRADGAGGMYVVGRLLQGSVDFGGGVLTGSNECFVARFDAAGNHLFSGLYGDAEISDAEADAQGIVLSGATRATADFGGGPLTTAGGTDALIARLDGAGSHVFSARYGDTSDQVAVAVGTDGSGQPVMAVSIWGTADFGGGVLTPAGLGIALVKLDGTGTHVYSQLFDGSFSSGITVNMHVDVDATGSVALAGELHGAADFGGGLLSTAGGTDVYLARFDAVGAHVFSTNYGSASYQVCNGVHFTSSGSIVLSGNFVNDIDFGGGTLTAGPTSPELFVAQLDASGAQEFTAQYAADGGAYACENAVADDGSILLVASASPNLDFGGGPLGPYFSFVGYLSDSVASATSPLLASSILARVGNRPNPFNPSTTIDFELTRPASVALAIADVRGRLLLHRDLGSLDAGIHEIPWDGRDHRGRRVASGVYGVSVRAGGERATHRIVLVE